MSFLIERLFTKAPRAIAYAPRATFSTSQYMRKTATETVKDTVHSVDKAVSSKLVDGIEAGQQAAQKVKAAAGLEGKEAKGKANEALGNIKGKANELAGEAKGKASELEGAAKGKANEVKGKL